MKAALVFPPATDPRAPHLALPSLAGALRNANISTDLYDLDLESLLWLMEKDTISQNLKLLQKKKSLGTVANLKSADRLLNHGSELIGMSTWALGVLRSKDFYDPHKFHAAREVIFDCTDLASMASPYEIKYSIHPITYGIGQYDERKLSDLISVASIPSANIFEDYWQRDFVPRLDATNPDIVGITITNRQQIFPGLTLAKRLRQRGHFVVVGGTVFSKFSEELQKMPSFFDNFCNAVIVYEGETAIVELANQLDGKHDFSKVPNCLYSKDGSIQFTKPHVENVNDLPTPDFEGLPLKKYLAPSLVLPILVGKGCYFNRCKFCDIPFVNHISKKPYRIRSTELIKQDILSLNERHKCRHFEITDEALAPKLLSSLSDALEPYSERDFRFTGYARLEPGFTKQICSKLFRMGFRKLFFGLESGDQETLDHMDKGIQLSNVRSVLEACSQAGINFHVFSIIGFPEEREKSARNTFSFFYENSDLISKAGNSFDIHPFGLELRTAYFDRRRELGIEIDESALNNDFNIGLERSEWTNTRGLEQSEVAKLIREFYEALMKTYGDFNNAPIPLWPPLEEHSILYSEFYPEAPFEWRTLLPSGNDSKFTLEWNPAAYHRKNGDQTIVNSRWGSVELEEHFYLGLVSSRPVNLSGLAERISLLSGDGLLMPDTVREFIDGLLRARILQLRLSS